jgi:hypothetical protein
MGKTEFTPSSSAVGVLFSIKRCVNRFCTPLIQVFHNPDVKYELLDFWICHVHHYVIGDHFRVLYVLRIFLEII